MKQNKRFNVGETVVVISGNDKGKTGKVLYKNDLKVVVEGVNIKTKHVRKTQQAPGRIVKVEKPISISNVRPFVDGQAVKLRARSVDGVKEIFYFDKNKQPVVYRALKSKVDEKS